MYSLTMVLVGFIATLRDLGAGQYLVQQKTLTMERIRATWAVQLGIGLMFGAIIAAASSVVASFYAQPTITDIMLVLALNFAVTPFQALPNAILTRELRFGTLAAIRFASTAAQALVAIGLTWGGFGPISLAWGNLAATAVGIAACTALRDPSLPWIPGLSGVKSVISFGGKITAVALLADFKGASPELFLGKLQGMTDTGLFSRGQGLVAMFERLVMDAVNTVALPFFAKQTREGADVAPSFLRACALVTGLGWSFLGCLSVLAFPLIRILYGNQWDAAVNPTRWMAVAMGVSVPTYICLAPLLASGAVSQVLRTAALAALVSVAFAGLGAWLGLLPLSQLLVPAAAVSTVLWLSLAKAHIRFRWKTMFGIFGKSAVVAAASVCVPLVASVYFGWRPDGVFPILFVSVPGAAIGFFAAAYLTQHAIWDEMLHLIGSLRR